MPNIREYDNSATLEPTETGISSLLTSASRVGGFYDQIGQAQTDEGRKAASTLTDAGEVAVNYVTNDQKSRGAPLIAQALSNLDEEWNAKVRGGKDANGNVIPPADPNDPTIRQKFMQDRLPAVFESLMEGFTTDKSREWAEQKVDILRDHFNVKTAADMSLRSYEVTKTNLEAETNQLSTAAMNDWTTVKTSLALIRHSNADAVANSKMSAADATRFSTEVEFEQEKAIVKAGAIGYVGNNPEAGLAEFSKPEYSKYISGTELKQLEQQAKTVQSAQRTDATRKMALQKQAEQDKSDQAEGQYLVKLHSDDPNVAASVTAKAISNDFTLNREARERMLGIAARENKPDTPAAVSAQTSVGIMKMMRDPDADPQTIRNAIYDARVKDPGEPGSITKADFTDLNKNLDDVKTPQGLALASDRNEFFKQYGPTIDPEMKLGNPTPLGAQGIYRAEKDARRQEQALRAKGIDPHSLYDPSSQYFLGKPERIETYRPSLADLAAFAAQQKERDKAAGITAPGVGGPVAPGKSVNLTANGSEVTGIQTLEIPAGMSPGDAMKWAREKGAKQVRLPDGRIGTVQ